MCQANTITKQFNHPQHDPGIANHAVDFLRPYISDYRFLFTIFDHEGSGKEDRNVQDLQLEIENLLGANGWIHRNSCIIIEPELESWLWVNSCHLHNATDWDLQQDIYKWIEAHGFSFKIGSTKPIRPKEAFEAALKLQKIPRSASLYYNIANNASYQNCCDSSFNKFINQIRLWFSVQ